MVVSRIRTGELATGTKLPPERELSEELGVSRNTLRAVIRALQQANYVQTERGRTGGSFVIWEGRDDERRGFRLSAMMRDRLLDMLRFRSVLEPGAAELAAGRALDDDERNNLRQRLEAARSGGAEFRLADAELHCYIAELSDCRSVVDQVVNVQLILNETLLQIVPLFGAALEHSHQQHDELVEAILAGEPERARTVMGAHVGATAELLRSFLD